MIIREIRVSNVRPYGLYSAQLNPNITLILGRNGTGKTTLLESMYYLLQGTSFKGRDRDMIALGQAKSHFLLLDDAGTERRASLELLFDDKVKKVFTIEQKNTARLPAKHRQPVVLFEPDELRLLSSSPQRRRQFFDGILCRLYPQYATALSRYQRVVLQRNELLKHQADTSSTIWDAHLFAWDIKFTELTDILVQHRREFIKLSNKHLSRLYSGMAGSDHTITVAYQSSLPPTNYAQNLLKQLEQRRHADAMRGFTSLGPHRDDFLVNLGGHPASETASRGEMRTIMLAYKLLEVELQQQTYGTNPLILMDDVFSELDSTREQQLMNALKNHQTIITATDLRDELKINASIITLTNKNEPN